MPPRFLLQTFGGLTLSVRDGGEMVLVNQRKRLALIAVLAAEGNGGMARERLFALFWPESDGERARNALYALRYRQRRCKSCGHRSSRGGPCALCGGTSWLS